MKSLIHLIRHGITEGNQKRLYYGASDIPLTSEGKVQLKELAEEGIYPQSKEADFYTTGLRRTKQTLALIYGETESEQIEELREMSFGDFEMKSYEDLKEKPEYIAWISDKSGQAASPGGESIVGFAARIRKGLEILIKKHLLKELSVRHSGKDAISTVVCHGGTIASIMEARFPGQREHFYKWIPDPGHGYTLVLEEGQIAAYEAF